MDAEIYFALRCALPRIAVEIIMRELRSSDQFERTWGRPCLYKTDTGEFQWKSKYPCRMTTVNIRSDISRILTPTPMMVYIPDRWVSDPAQQYRAIDNYASKVAVAVSRIKSVEVMQTARKATATDFGMPTKRQQRRQRKQKYQG